jgi:NAD(P)H-flavin reductase/ferredoxin
MTVIHIEQWPQPISAGKKSLLDAALDAGVPYPHGCSSGECGSCKSQLMNGEVSMGLCSPDALSSAERAAGMILACRARPTTDVTVKWLSVAQALPIIKCVASVLELRPLAHDVMVLTLVMPASVRMNFRPGQYAKLRVGKSPVRSYSMANQPGQAQLEFHVRLVPNGKMSGVVANALKVGDRVDVQGPFGDAGWDDSLRDAHVQTAAPLLLLAGGTGMAPMLSVLDAALSSGVPGKQIHLYHGVRTERDSYANQPLQARALTHGFRFVQVYSDDGAGNQRSGFVHEALGEDFDSLVAARIFAAGPPPMVDAVKELALKRGALAHHIRADAFYAAPPENTSAGLWGRLSAWGRS